MTSSLAIVPRTKLSRMAAKTRIRQHGSAVYVGMVVSLLVFVENFLLPY